MYAKQASALPATAIRPPGALPEDDFLAACVRCGLCVRDCPYDTLKLAELGDNVATGTPYFEARRIPCEMCEDIPCVVACPTGALDRSLTDIGKAKMGLAVLIDQENCLNFLGLRCDVCYRVCPVIDQAITLERIHNPRSDRHAMLLPTVAVSKPEGVRATVMELAQKMQKPVVLYIKDEGYVTVDVVKSLVDAGVISWIKYAVVRQDPLHDPLLDKLTHAVSRDLIVSGIGEQPAIVHWQHFGVEAYTAGCVCIAPNRSQEMLMELQSGDLETAEEIRRRFTKLEDLRNTYGPIPVLHHAVKLAGIADTGPMLPLMADLDEKIQAKISDAARDVLAWSID